MKNRLEELIDMLKNDYDLYARRLNQTSNREIAVYWLGCCTELDIVIEELESICSGDVQ